MNKRSWAFGQSITAKTHKQWRFLVGLWCIAGLVAVLAPWNIAAGAALFATFLHLAATE